MIIKMFQRIPRHCFPVFLIIWLFTGLTINLHDQRAFNLQQMGVDAVATYGTYTLGHSSHERLRPLGDTFYAEKGILPAKQPGQFTVAAVPYFIMSTLGLSYEYNYDVASSMVTWTSTSLISALGLTFLYLLLLEWRFGRNEAFWAAIATGCLSHWLVFSGIAHHDIIASAYLVIALYLSERNLIRHDGQSIKLSIGSGLFAGLVIFTSMLPALMVFALGIYVFFTFKWKHVAFTGVGFLLGILPLALYNYNYFGNPLTQANVAGNYADTFFAFNIDQFKHHLNAYWGTGGLSIWKFSPIIAVGLFGLFFISNELKRIKIFLALAFILQMAYLLNIETLGTCQYGPRYLLPLMPFLAIGVAVLLKAGKDKFAIETGIVFGVLGGYSLLVTLYGAFGGAMQCDLESFAFLRYVGERYKYNMEMYPLFWPMLTAFLLVVGYYLHKAIKQRQEEF